ncbi:hypothetical protein V2J09_023347 [Rumex salicifolius]
MLIISRVSKSCINRCLIGSFLFFSRHHYVCSIKLYSNTSYGLWRKCNGIVRNSLSTQFYRRCQFLVYIAPVPVGISWIWPSLTASSHFSVALKLISTQATDQIKVIDDKLNHQILYAVENKLSDGVICNLIDRLRREGSFPGMARSILQSLHHKRMILSINASDLLLEAASQKNDIELSLDIFKEILTSSRAPSFKSYFHLARAFSKMDDHIQLLKFVKEVTEMTFPRSLIIMNRMIFALAECGNSDKALAIFDFMKSSDCKPDFFTYNTIIGILGRLGKVDDMIIKFLSMKEAGISPELVTYNTLINNFGKSYRIDLCMICWRELGEKGIEPDLRTYSSMIDSLGRCGNVEEALRLFNEMKCRKIQLSIYVYRSLIDSCKKMGKLEVAIILQEEMMASMSDLVGPSDFKRKKR